MITVENLPLTFRFILNDGICDEDKSIVFHGALISKSVVNVSWRTEEGFDSTTYNIDSVVRYLNDKDWILMEGNCQ